MVKQILSKVFLAVFTVLLLTNALNLEAAEATKALDNKTFIGEIKKVGETKGVSEALIFKNGKVQSDYFKNFKAATYLTNKQANATTFVAQSEKQGNQQLKWFGAVKESNLDSTFILYKEGQKPEVYTMKGQLKQ